MPTRLPLASRLLLALTAIEFLLLYAPTMLWLWSRWTMSVWQHAHGLLIPPVVAYLVWQELRATDHQKPASSRWGWALLAPALLLRAFDAGLHTELLSAASLVLAGPGLALLFVGSERSRGLHVPLLFLALALPIPLSLTESIHFGLRQLVTAATVRIVPMFGIPTFAEGTTLHIPQGMVEVADACSGFSTLYATLAIATLTAYTSQASAARRIAVMLCAAPLAIAANIGRVVLLVALVAWYGPSILQTLVHPLSGVLTFAVCLPVIFWAGQLSTAEVRP